MAEEEHHTDDMSTGLHLQQFMDEWYYRCLHSGLAHEWDRERCAVAALDLFELQGVTVEKEEKPAMAALDDDLFIDAVVKRMPDDVRKTFEHFALQLQLVMSAASRVRCALEEGPPEEVAHIMEEGDQGVNSQILKQTIIEATMEVGEIREIHDNWEASTSKRIARLSRCQRETEQGRIELEKLNIRLSSFGKEQNEKSKGVLMGLASKNDKTLLQTVFKGWWTHKVKYFAEKEIHDKFQQEIDDAQRKLMEYKQEQVKNVRQVLLRTADDNDKVLTGECFRLWVKGVQEEKDERELEAQTNAARQKMGNLKEAQKENAKKAMLRIGAGNDEALKMQMFQAWFTAHEEEQKSKEFEAMVKAQEEKMQEFLKKQSEGAKGVLSRISGSSDTGLLHMTFGAWQDELKSAKKAMEMENVMKQQQARMKTLNDHMKSSANDSAQRANEQEMENIVMAVFMNWATEARVGRLIRHYSGQMDSKKQQLDAVQGMFKTFAQQLEHGINSTPRTTRKTTRSSTRADRSGDAQARPPQMPSGGY